MIYHDLMDGRRESQSTLAEAEAAARRAAEQRTLDRFIARTAYLVRPGTVGVPVDPFTQRMILDDDPAELPSLVGRSVRFELTAGEEAQVDRMMRRVR
jgi:hypothetical protein